MRAKIIVPSFLILKGTGHSVCVVEDDDGKASWELVTSWLEVKEKTLQGTHIPKSSKGTNLRDQSGKDFQIM